MDSVQMLDNLNVGAELEEWPLHRDLTLSPPLKSQPITLEQEGEHLTLKSNSVSPHTAALIQGCFQSYSRINSVIKAALAHSRLAPTKRKAR